MDKLLIGAYSFSLIINGQKILYRGFWKRKKYQYVFNDIAYLEKKRVVTRYNVSETIYAFSNEEEKLFMVTSMLSCYENFLRVIEKNNLVIVPYSRARKKSRKKRLKIIKQNSKTLK